DREVKECAHDRMEKRRRPSAVPRRPGNSRRPDPRPETAFAEERDGRPERGQTAMRRARAAGSKAAYRATGGFSPSRAPSSGRERQGHRKQDLGLAAESEAF